MMDQSGGWVAQSDCTAQGLEREVFLHAIACGPTDDAPGVQIDDNGQVQRRNRLKPLDIDHEMYKWRYLIENYFQKLKEFKRTARRACKTGTPFAAMIYLCAGVINSRQMSTRTNIFVTYLLKTIDF